jgi:hypothetical protein
MGWSAGVAMLSQPPAFWSANDMVLFQLPGHKEILDGGIRGLAYKVVLQNEVW